jgi:hypothetical protein
MKMINSGGLCKIGFVQGLQKLNDGSGKMIHLRIIDRGFTVLKFQVGGSYRWYNGDLQSLSPTLYVCHTWIVILLVFLSSMFILKACYADNDTLGKVILLHICQWTIQNRHISEMQHVRNHLQYSSAAPGAYCHVYHGCVWW